VYDACPMTRRETSGLNIIINAEMRNRFEINLVINRLLVELLNNIIWNTIVVTEGDGGIRKFSLKKWKVKKI